VECFSQSTYVGSSTSELAEFTIGVVEGALDELERVTEKKESICFER